ncbi:hypothetical protein J6590_010112 [Homalodisca vitripennis]|nr:hypothetical protein J6590_010112 [Homalodisca vitripennis]
MFFTVVIIPPTSIIAGRILFHIYGFVSSTEELSIRITDDWMTVCEEGRERVQVQPSVDVRTKIFNKPVSDQGNGPPERKRLFSKDYYSSSSMALRFVHYR